MSTSPSFTSGGTAYKCMDLAPSALQLTSTNPPDMAQELIGEDLVSYSYLPTGNIPSTLTNIGLEAIFACNASLISPS